MLGHRPPHPGAPRLRFVYTLVRFAKRFLVPKSSSLVTVLYRLVHSSGTAHRCMRCVAHCMHSVQCRSWWSAHSRHCGDGTRTAPLLSICISGSVNVTLCTTREPQTGSLQSPHMTVTSPHATSALHARVEAGARWRWNALPCASHALCGSRANQSPHARHEMSPPATPWHPLC